MKRIRILNPVYDAIAKCWTCVALAYVDGKLIAIKGGSGRDSISAHTNAGNRAQREIDEFEFPSLRGPKSYHEFLLSGGKE